MYKLLIVGIFALLPTICVGEDSLFRTIAILGSSNKLDELKIKCSDYKKESEPYSFICSYYLDDDQSFIQFFQKAEADGCAGKLWEIDPLAYSNKELQNIRVSREGGFVYLIMKRIVEISGDLSLKDKHHKECDVLGKLYDLSDGYFRNDILNLIANNKNSKTLINCISETNSDIGKAIMEINEE